MPVELEKYDIRTRGFLLLGVPETRTADIIIDMGNSNVLMPRSEQTINEIAARSNNVNELIVVAIVLTKMGMF
jgi:hypothetical protein